MGRVFSFWELGAFKVDVQSRRGGRYECSIFIADSGEVDHDFWQEAIYTCRLFFVSWFNCNLWSFYCHLTSFIRSVSCLCKFTVIWTPGLSEGVLCNHPCPSVRWSVCGPSLNISETALRIFLIFCMKLGQHKEGGRKGGITPFLVIFDLFCPYLKNGCNDFDEILLLNSPHWCLTPRENRMS